MSGVTITAGWSFSGGITITEAPAAPQENTAAWFAGNATPAGRSSVDRITYATDTATASVRGPLSGGKYNLAAASNYTYGWFAMGTWPAPSYPEPSSSVDRITYATDTNTASVRGPGGGARTNIAAAGNTTDAWFGGGKAPTGQPFQQLPVSSVNRITYATDTATASVSGPLSLARQSLAAAGNTTDGWFGGGYVTPAARSTVDRITYATDTATASVRGPLSLARQSLAAAGNTTNGWFGGGQFSGSIVDRITYATDTATASVRGPLSLARSQFSAAGNTTDGWFGGGQAPAGVTSIVDRITYATDTATASVRGPLSLTRLNTGAAGGTQ